MNKTPGLQLPFLEKLKYSSLASFNSNRRQLFQFKLLYCPLDIDRIRRERMRKQSDNGVRMRDGVTPVTLMYSCSDATGPTSPPSHENKKKQTGPCSLLTHLTEKLFFFTHYIHQLSTKYVAMNLELL